LIEFDMLVLHVHAAVNAGDWHRATHVEGRSSQEMTVRVQASSERSALIWESLPTKKSFLHCTIPNLEYNGARRQLAPDTQPRRSKSPLRRVRPPCLGFHSCVSTFVADRHNPPDHFDTSSMDRSKGWLEGGEQREKSRDAFAHSWLVASKDNKSVVSL